MTQYNTLNIKLVNSQMNKLKSGIKNGTELTFKLSSNVVGGSYDEKIPLINCYELMYKFQNSVKLLQIIPQLI